jgi:integrase
MPEVPRALVVPLSVGQVQALCAAVDPLFRPAVLLGAGCGARASEALGVRKANVRFLRREILFERQVSTRKPWPLVPLKTASSHAVVPAPQFVLDALAPLCAEPAKDGRLFHRDGDPVGPHLLHRAVRAAVTEAGLPADTSFHSLRHHYASTLIGQGESPVVVASRLRHRTPNESMRTYAHLWPDDDDRTRRIIEAAWVEVETAEGAG